MPLFREQMMVAIGPRHRLANGKGIRVRDLDGECYIHRMNWNLPGSRPILRGARVKWKAVPRSERDDSMLAIVAAGMGWGFMPAQSVRRRGVVGLPSVEPEFWREVILSPFGGGRVPRRWARFCGKRCVCPWFGGEGDRGPWWIA